MHFGHLRLYLDGRTTEAASGERRSVICPGTGREAGTIAWAGREDAVRALQAAEAAFPGWARTPIAERRGWMLKLRDAVHAKSDLLQQCIHYELGKPWTQVGEDQGMLESALEFYADAIRHHHGEIIPDLDGHHEHRIVWEPLGPVVAFLAWNFPLLNLAYKVAPALAAGCPIILLPAPNTPLSAYAFGAICEEIGLPRGVVNILAGPVESVANTLSSSPIPRMLTLIGSQETALQVVAAGATSVKRHSLELGGNAPVILFESADLTQAANITCALKFANSGQICVAPNRVYVHRQHVGRFQEMLVDRARRVRLGHGPDGDATMGPVATAAVRERIERRVAQAVAQGAVLLHGGGRPRAHPDGFFFEPTVLAGVTDDMEIARQEIFGPVISVLEFDRTDEVLRRANATPAGLASYVFTRDLAEMQRAARELQFGEVMINTVCYSIHLPHLGIKQSGIGLDCSRHALEEYMTRKRITTSL